MSGASDKGRYRRYARYSVNDNEDMYPRDQQRWSITKHEDYTHGDFWIKATRYSEYSDEIKPTQN
jgi:hypothetical protein